MTTPEERDDAVRQVLDDRGWHLVTDHAQFAQSVYAELQAKYAGSLDELPARALTHAVIHQYCFVLHAACGEAGSLRQQSALRELWCYLYRVAPLKASADIMEDCAQRALEKIWQHRDQCHDPGSFLGWCGSVLLNQIRDRGRSQNSADQAIASELDAPYFEDVLPDETGLRGQEPIPVVEPAGLENISNEQLREQLIEAIRVCLKNVNQQAIIVESFFSDQTSQELADRLQATIGNIQTMKFRALKRLARCKAVIRLYQEWFDRWPPGLASPL